MFCRKVGRKLIRAGKITFMASVQRRPFSLHALSQTFKGSLWYSGYSFGRMTERSPVQTCVCFIIRINERHLLLFLFYNNQ